MSSLELSARFFLQLAVVLAAGRACTWVGRRFLQPPVVCEMIAGVLLGPSLLGWAWPEAAAYIFPSETMPLLYAVSQLGLALYMFTVGLEFRTSHLAEGWKSSAGVSVAGILAPMALGAALGFHLLSDATYFSAGVKPWQAMLFTGASMSITAFPMLARIIVERGLSRTKIGTVALGAGAFDDACAWLLLAIILGTFESNMTIIVMALGGGLLYAAAMVGLGRSGIRPPVGQAMLLLALGAWFTDLIGLHAVFGGFLLGAALPKDDYSDKLREKVEPVASSLLVPLFFAYSGLNTRLDLLGAAGLWGMALVFLLLSSLGKGLACAAAARLGGYPWPEALAVGTLMNARGLMELILLNIGLQRGVITPAYYTLMTFMAVVTTLAATPVFERVKTRIIPR